MKLQRLVLRNFKGVRDFTLDAGGHDVSIYGDNATGKTTLFDSFCWLLFDKDSLNRKDFEIKTLDAEGKPLHGINHEVEAELELGARTLTLRKVYAEKWTKKRGSAQAEFTGHTTDHYIDGVPVQKKEYDATIQSIADEKIFKLLTSPTYFPETMHWQERRKVLLELAGLPADKSLDDRRKVLMARRAEINRELDKIPVRIDETMRGLPEERDGNLQELNEELRKIRELRSAAIARKVRLEAGGEVAEKTRRLAEVKTAILNAEREAMAAADKALKAERQKLFELRTQLDERQAHARRKGAEVEDIRATIVKLDLQLDTLRTQWQSLHALEYVERGIKDTCPTCGQALPAEQVESAREKALSDFNLTRAQGLEKISAEGKVLKSKREAIAAALELTQAELVQITAARDEFKKRVESEEARLTVHVTPDAPLPEPELLAEQVRLNEEIAALKAGSQALLVEVRQQIGLLDSDIADTERSIAALDQRERGLKRVDELKAQERKLAAEFESLEGELYQAEQELREKVRLLEEQINSRFELARFKLFDVLINGGVEECCEVLYDGVPYSGGLNHGARINVGLDIINTLSEHYRFDPPVWVDNAEAVTSLLPSIAQQIRLVVSGDKKLRIEIQKSEAE